MWNLCMARRIAPGGPPPLKGVRLRKRPEVTGAHGKSGKSFCVSHPERMSLEFHLLRLGFRKQKPENQKKKSHSHLHQRSVSEKSQV